MQQDAHEFLNYLLNTVADLLQGALFVWNPVHVGFLIITLEEGLKYEYMIEGYPNFLLEY